MGDAPRNDRVHDDATRLFAELARHAGEFVLASRQPRRVMSAWSPTTTVDLGDWQV